MTRPHVLKRSLTGIMKVKGWKVRVASDLSEEGIVVDGLLWSIISLKTMIQ